MTLAIDTSFAVRRYETPILGALFTLSGAAPLIYQVLWVRELGLLFGSTAQAAALTIAIFFAGIALGGWLFGRLSARLHRPLRAFGWVEIGVAATALGHFQVADTYVALFPGDPHYDAKAWEVCLARHRPGRVVFCDVAPCT